MEQRNFNCVDCAARSPDVETEYTLISSRFGWRLNRRVARDGAVVLEWRCPTCWARFKRERTPGLTPADGVPAALPRKPKR